jgi:hypothetical protein
MHGMARLGEGLIKILRSLAVVFDNENLHGTSISEKGPRRVIRSRT